MRFETPDELWPPGPTQLHVQVGWLRLTFDQVTGDCWGTCGREWVDVERALEGDDWMWIGPTAQAYSLGRARQLERVVPPLKLDEWRSGLRSILKLGGSKEFAQCAVELLFLRVTEGAVTQRALGDAMGVTQQSVGRHLHDVIESGLDILPLGVEQPVDATARRSLAKEVMAAGGDLARWRQDVVTLAMEVRAAHRSPMAEQVIVVGQSLITAQYLGWSTGKREVARRIVSDDPGLVGFGHTKVGELLNALQRTWP
jgi:hypothetical protein